jgi:hypothetical protein
MPGSLRGGGVGSAVIGRPFLDLPSLALLDISALPPKVFSQSENMPVSGGPKQDFAVVAQQCWDGLEETAVIMLCAGGGSCNFYRPSGFYPNRSSYA